MKRQQINIITTPPTTTIKKYSEQLPLIPRSGGEDRDLSNREESIRTKIIVKSSEEPSSKPINIAIVTEDKHTKIQTI